MFAVAVLGLLAVMAIAFASRTALERQAAANLVEQARAQAVAEGGLHWAVAQLQGQALRKATDGPVERWYFPPGTDLATSTTPPSWNSAFTGPLAAVAATRNLRKSSHLGGEYVEEGDHFLLKVFDTAGQLNVNGQQLAMAEMLNVLGLEIQAAPGGPGIDPIGGAGDAIIAYRDGLPNSTFESKSQVLDAIRTIAADETDALDRFAALRDYVAVHGWRQTSSSASEVSPDTVVPRDGYDLEARGRFPININSAPAPVLVAMMAGVGGRPMTVTTPGSASLAGSVAGVNSIPGLGASYAELARTPQASAPSVDLATARTVAAALIAARTTPFETFAQLDAFLAQQVATLTLTPPQASVLFSSMLASPIIDDHNPDMVLRNRIVQKSDLFYEPQSGTSASTILGAAGATEACFSSMGYYEIQSIGRVCTEDGIIQAEAEVRSAVKIFDVVRHTTERDFATTMGLPTGSSFADLDVLLWPEPILQPSVAASPAVGHVTWRPADSDVLGAVTLEATYETDLGAGASGAKNPGELLTGGSSSGDIAPDGLLSYRSRPRQLDYDANTVNKPTGSGEFFVKLMTDPSDGSDEVLYYASRSFAELGLAPGVSDIGVTHRLERFGEKIVSTRFFWSYPAGARHPSIPTPIPFDFDPDDPTQNPIIFSEVVADIGPSGLDWKAGEWHHIAFNWFDRGGPPSPVLQELFLDGVNVGGFDSAGNPLGNAFMIRAVEVTVTTTTSTSTEVNTSSETGTTTTTYSTIGYDWDLQGTQTFDNMLPETTNGQGTVWQTNPDGSITVMASTVDDMAGVDLSVDVTQTSTVNTTTTNTVNTTTITKDFYIYMVRLRSNAPGNQLHFGGYSYQPIENATLVRTGLQTGTAVRERFTNATLDDFRLYSDRVDFSGVAQADRQRYLVDSAVYPATISGKATFPEGAQVGTVTATILYAPIPGIEGMMQMRGAFGTTAGSVPSMPFNAGQQGLLGGPEDASSLASPFHGGPILLAGNTVDDPANHPVSASGDVYYALQWRGQPGLPTNQSPFALLDVTITAVSRPIFMDKR